MVVTHGVAELVVVRHGQSVANAAFARARRQGLLDAGVTGRDTDVDLTEQGHRQAVALGHWLAALPPERRPEVVTCSPYLRARETWRIAAGASGLALPDPTTDDRLVDRLTGEHELLTAAAIAQRFPAEVARLAREGEWAYRPPGGESYGDIAARLGDFLRDLHATHAGRRVVVVAHDAVVLMMRAVIEHLDWPAVADVVAAGPVRNASVTRFVSTAGRLALVEYNDDAHLSGPSATD